MRGEKRYATVIRADGSGSPPHARGKASTSIPRPSYTGITPACAGKSKRAVERFFFPRDHPRMRGEKPQMDPYTQRPIGSPPHARGKGAYAVSACSFSRITPACAGKRKTQALSCTQARDHPRMRGEKKKRHFYMGLSLGSPPHARGKAEEGVERRFQGGITPACAGKRTPIF